EGQGLRYQFKAGEKLGYTVEVATRIENRAPGRTSTTDMTQQIELTWEVGRVGADGRATITQTVGRIRFKAESAGAVVMEHDTKTPGEPPSAPDGSDPKASASFASRERIVRRLNALVGARLSATIDAQGRIANIRLLEREGGGGAAPAGDWA